MELVQTVCAVVSLILSLYAVQQVISIKKRINSSVKQKIIGDGNYQSNHSENA